MNRILIINTGGTIGMVKTENGYVPNQKEFHAHLNKMPELQEGKICEWDIVDMDPLLDSSNMTVEDWNKIGELISINYEGYAGFVILHGTDTMAYTASALSFMLENLGKPVIITGSQIPICEIRSDGKDNIIAAMMIASSGKINEVCIYFRGELLRGNRAIKYSADGFMAFKSPNSPILAEAGIAINYNEAMLLPKPTESFRFQKLKDIPIGVIKVFPGIQFELFNNIMTESLKGVVIETFGAGNIPSTAKSLLPIIEKAFRNGTVATVCTQCPQGTVLLGTYETSNALKKAGAVSGKDMTTEAAIAKMYYLFSKEYDVETICRLMETNLRGEE
ncbi:MAG: asparaginase [Eubacteriales bacterium]|nr:asparaginase [Eubacteriales bacterium]